MGDHSVMPTPTPTRLERVIRVCEEFEAAWKSPHRAQIEGYLDEIDEQERVPLLRELILVELQLRARGGERPGCEEYSQRFPNDTSAVEAAFRAMGEIEALKQAWDHQGIAEPIASCSGSATEPRLLGIATNPLPRLELDGGKEKLTGAGGSLISSAEDPAVIGRFQVIRRLGEGGFGRVYLAWDDDLKRTVAIKVPRPNVFSSADQIELFVNEARMAAQLRHPAIVAVHDVGRQPDGSVYIVLEHVEGRLLSDLIKAGVLPLEATLELLARVADAAHYAHKLGLVHRDLKPSNILVDPEGNPRIADFGLAVHEDVQKFRWGEVAGTIPYMAPEQIRGETHRLDGRTDVWAIGVILYRALTGRRPFSGAFNELFDEIRYRDPKPPRQINDAIPKELERICLKCLAKRMTDRYNSALDLADDLRSFLRTRASDESIAASQHPEPIAILKASMDPASQSGAEPLDSSGQAVHIVPKGLCSFDENDADFFSELLPGPRGRDGLPDSIRFWKMKIEAVDADKSFRVGLVYGPSGCGKSSLIRAGLLPRLGSHVTSLYVEAAIDETESRIWRSIRKAIAELARDSDLVNSFTRLRLPGLLQPGQKVLIVVDQFEQWLFGRHELEASELVAALRQCDGERIQALCLVRDDFWMAATRFFRELEVDLVPGQNVAAVDLFDAKHARKVLVAYGRAYDALPSATSELSKEQKAFLDQAVTGLAQDGRVVPVRLALFAEMVKGRVWTPVTLREVGGMEGVGVRFLEDKLSSVRAQPKHRYHLQAALAVLKSLLPGTNADMKGRMRSIENLRAVSGYADRPSDFTDLIRMLDSELRLITPVDPEGQVEEEVRAPTPRRRYFQLTHDYLVHALREWLTQHQRETLRGRAELHLAERADLWNFRPERRFLPSWSEWVGILFLTRRRDWTTPQRRMIAAATRYHGVRIVAAVALLSASGVGGIWLQSRLSEQHRYTVASESVKRLLVAEINQVPGIIEALADHRERVRPILAAIAADPAWPPGERLRASLALLADDPEQIEYLLSHTLEAEPHELLVIRERLITAGKEIKDRLWNLAGNRGEGQKRRLRASCILAALEPDSDQWRQVAPDVVEALVKEGPLHVERWMDALRPSRKALLEPLAAIFRSEGRSEVERSLAITVLTDFGGDRPDLLAELIQVADGPMFETILARLGPHGERAIAPLTRALSQEVEATVGAPTHKTHWRRPGRASVVEADRAQGLVLEDCAICQTMELDRFDGFAQSLRPAGYRPVRVRPFDEGGIIRVAAVWVRDGRDWQVLLGAGPEKVAATDAECRGLGYEPVDIGAYQPVGDDQAGIKYVVCWVKADPPESARDARLFTGVEHAATISGVAMENEGLRCVSLHRIKCRDGRLRYSGVARRSADQAVVAADEDLFGYEAKVASNGYQEDVCLDLDPGPQNCEDRWRADLLRAEEAARGGPVDLAVYRTRAESLLRLFRYRDVVEAATSWIDASPEAASPFYFRALARARLGDAEGARADVVRFGTLTDQAVGAAEALTALVTIFSGRTPEGIAKLEATLPEHATHGQCLYFYARAYALAGQVATEGAMVGRRADRAVALIRDAIRQGYDDYAAILREGDFEGLHSNPRFKELFGPNGLDLRFAAVWGRDPGWESQEVHGLAPESHLAHCRNLAAQGFLPVSIAVARRGTGVDLVAASAWRRPRVSDETHDSLARRKSRAAVALARLGRADRIWHLLEMAPDPSLRTYLIHDLGALGVDVRAVLGQLEVERDSSIRRALLLALGEFPPTALPENEWEALATRLEGLYAREPDAGVHACAGWLLRRLGRREIARRTEARVARADPSGDRNWYVDLEGLTFMVIARPGAVVIGSPPQEFNFKADEAQRLVKIDRTFAIGATEVTAGQYARFLRAHPEFRREEAIANDVGPEGPAETIDAFEAAAFCRWLGERDGIPEEQQCYAPLPKIFEARRVGRLPLAPGYLKRSGYRLPTDAEWEFACRAGSQVIRPYGRSVSMLPYYAWSGLTSGWRTHRAGELKPNEFGLFDMIGGVWEWCTDAESTAHPNFGGRANRDDTELPFISQRTPIMIRGGAYNYSAPMLRCGYRSAEEPATQSRSVGFRVARTIR
jgi:serine/threonine protein kinase/formylglycine-generating enzyme required for sulfatase activity